MADVLEAYVDNGRQPLFASPDGRPPEDVAERVNASVNTIEHHYDKADLDVRRRRLRDRMEDRRRDLVDELNITDDD